MCSTIMDPTVGTSGFIVEPIDVLTMGIRIPMGDITDHHITMEDIIIPTPMEDIIAPIPTEDIIARTDFRALSSACASSVSSCMRSRTFSAMASYSAACTGGIARLR